VELIRLKKNMEDIFNQFLPNVFNAQSVGQISDVDRQSILKCGAAALGSFAGFQVLKSVVRPTKDPNAVLIDPSESLHNDTLIRRNLLKLQLYRDLNPVAFGLIVKNIDCLLFLEKVLDSKEARATHNDKYIAFWHYGIAVRQMNIFQLVVLEMLGNEHGKCVNLLVEDIYSRLQKHLSRVFDMCSDFKLENILKAAPREVEQALAKEKRMHREQSVY
jgi:hypothetical protein